VRASEMLEPTGCAVCGAALTEDHWRTHHAEKTMVTCPDCKGKKEKVYWGCPGLKRIVLPCDRCAGVGIVSSDWELWKILGLNLQIDRENRDVSLREEAKRRKMSASELSRMERGIIKPQD
jgi:hypothetical protein